MEITLTRARIRSWVPGDAASLARHADNPNVWRRLRDRFPHPYTLRDARRFIRTARRARPETVFAIALGDEAVGGIGFHPRDDVYRRTAEIGFWLGQDFWGRGIATEAVRAVVAHAFSHHDLHRIEAYVFEGNLASGRVLEKAGLVLEGTLRGRVVKDGRTLDERIYAIVRGRG